MFTKVNRLKNWVIGSLVSETGSEYLFGFDPSDGLMWLERAGIEYSPLDPVWTEAEGTVRASMVTTASSMASPARLMEEDVIEDQYVIPDVTDGVGEPKKVHRSIAAYDEMGLPAEYSYADDRIVGDFGEGEEYDDEEISAQAEAYLRELEEE